MVVKTQFWIELWNSISSCWKIFHSVHLFNFVTTSAVGKSVGNAFSSKSVEPNFKNYHGDSELNSKQTAKKLDLWGEWLQAKMLEWKPGLWMLVVVTFVSRYVVKGQRCAFEIASDENLVLKDYPEKRTFSVVYSYTVTLTHFVLLSLKALK